MREIKFRAWDKEEKKFVSKGFVLLDSSGQQHWLLNDLTYLMPSKDKALEITQYTGLKDKNGKEIYEGDIVNPRYEEVKPLKIVFVNGGFVGIAGDDTVENYSIYLIPDNSMLKDCEVIGNIYENPSLIDR